MCVTRRHYEYRPVWPGDYDHGDDVDILAEVVLDSEESDEADDELDTIVCTCGKRVSWGVWNECNDLAYNCPDRE